MNAKYYYTLGGLLLLGLGLNQSVQGQQASSDSLIKVAPVNWQSFLNPNADRPIAYGRQPAWKVTGALSSVSGSDLQKNFTTNIANTFFAGFQALRSSRAGENQAMIHQPSSVGVSIRSVMQDVTC